MPGGLKLLVRNELAKAVAQDGAIYWYCPFAEPLSWVQVLLKGVHPRM